MHYKLLKNGVKMNMANMQDDEHSIFDSPFQLVYVVAATT